MTTRAAHVWPHLDLRSRRDAFKAGEPKSAGSFVKTYDDGEESSMQLHTCRLSVFTLTAALVGVLPFGAIGANCGHDVHGAPRIEETKLAPNNSIITYFSPATLIMDNPSDPRHRAFGECRGQAVVTDGVQRWQGGCVWKKSDADVFWVF
jgi:hypothetical protein